MAILQRLGIAAPTLLTVEEVLPAAHPAYATVFTVVLLLGEVVLEEVAGQAGIGPKAHPTATALLAHCLPGVAESTDHLLHQFPLYFVALFGVRFVAFVDFVVAMPAPEYFAAARCHKLAPPPVVRTTVFAQTTIHVFYRGPGGFPDFLPTRDCGIGWHELAPPPAVVGSVAVAALVSAGTRASPRGALGLVLDRPTLHAEQQ
mmetsp:Transcript_21190/g.58848  ORF Transcript_21190/g.58848 Transcript_21190/m.58848 type:complete len:203 (-) Transcript_21190:34-642(-)